MHTESTGPSFRTRTTGWGTGLARVKLAQTRTKGRGIGQANDVGSILPMDLGLTNPKFHSSSALTSG